MRYVLSLLAGLSLLACTKDKDGDGFDSKTDCNDNNPEINPDAAELCNDLDDDCDGVVDEDAGETWYLDADGDDYGDDDSSTRGCEQPTGYVALDGDCDDADDRFHPGAVEDDCTDPNDYNCDGSVGYADADTDGFAACEDCNDADGEIHPGAAEVCDDVDNNCDNLVDEQDPNVEGATTYNLDYDQDGYGSATITQLACEQPDLYIDNADDCDDLRAESYPGAVELCDGYDNDCDTLVDEDSPDLQTFWADLDSDGYGDPDSPLVACAAPDGYVTNALDCDDTLATVNPAEDEVCDEVDNDCDALIDDEDNDTLHGASDLWYVDADADGYGSPDDAVLACEGPEGYVDNNDDCDDDALAINPDATEVCDGVDNDCNEGADEASAADASTWYLDDDLDGYGQTDSTTVSCNRPSGYSDLPDDCDDTQDTVNPAQPEICNDSLDNDCDGGFEACTLSLDEADVALLGESSLDDAGIALGPVGDIDGDGFDDFMVGARDNDEAGTDAGAAYLMYGPVTGGVSELGSLGVKLTGNDGGDKFGRSFGGGTDLDGDGVVDLVISAPSDEAGATAAGAAYLFSGASVGSSGTLGAADALHTWLGDTSYDYLGVAIETVDLSGDGVADVLLSVTGEDAGATNAGAIYLVNGPISAGTTDFGSGGTTDARVLGETSNDGMGQVVDAGMDLDGDGVGDLLVGLGKDATVGTNSGAVYVVTGPLSGTFSLADADAKLLASTAGYQLGTAIAFLGDQDGDGHADFAAGSSTDATNGADAGAVFVVYGVGLPADLDGSTVNDIATATFWGDGTGNQLGEAVAGEGDFDGDGTHDLLMGATNAGTVNQGAAYLVYGPVSGSSQAGDADGVFIGQENGDAAGGVLGYAGDVNGGGFDALLIAARNSDRAGTDSGTIYMILELGL